MSTDVELSVRVFADKARQWNVTVFEHISRKKCELVAHIRGIDRVLRRNHSDFLVQVDIDLLAELEEVLRHEESLWLQKSQVYWASLGDRNTLYFHKCAMQRRRTNYITSLKASDDSWCSDQHQRKNMVVGFYQELFTSCGSTDLSFTMRGQFHQCNVDMCRSFMALVLDEEGISLVWLSVRDSPIWTLGDGRSVDFWRDAWLGEVVPLVNHIVDQSRVPSLPQILVNNMVDSMGCWRWHNCAALLPDAILHHLAVCMTPQK
ncbi:hypothetical protein V6N13_025275 [Hibiscus sabdariffa]